MENRSQAPNNNHENTNSGTAPPGDSPVTPDRSDSPVNNDSHVGLNDSPQQGFDENPRVVLSVRPSELDALTASLAANNGSLLIEIIPLNTDLQELPQQEFNRNNSEHRTNEVLRVVSTDPLVADAVNGPSTRSNIESSTEVTTSSDLIEPLHFSPNSKSENLSIDGTELIPGFATDRATALSYLPFPAKAAYTISICWSGVKALSDVDQEQASRSTIIRLIKCIPHEISLVVINGYALYHYRATSEPLSQGLRVSIIVSLTAGAIDGVFQAMHSSSWEMVYGAACAIIEGSIALYLSYALVRQTMRGNPNFPASNYEFLKRSFILQAEFLISEMSISRKKFTDEELRIMEHSAKCDLAKIRTVFGRTVTHDAYYH